GGDYHEYQHHVARRHVLGGDAERDDRRRQPDVGAEEEPRQYPGPRFGGGAPAPPTREPRNTRPPPAPVTIPPITNRGRLGTHIPTVNSARPARSTGTATLSGVTMLALPSAIWA